MEMVNAGIYISKEHYNKLGEMATALRQSRNKVIQQLIDGAEFEPAPPIKRVALKTNGAGALREAGAIL